jgi:hypothetical protein
MIRYTYLASLALYQIVMLHVSILYVDRHQVSYRNSMQKIKVSIMLYTRIIRSHNVQVLYSKVS